MKPRVVPLSLIVLTSQVVSGCSYPLRGYTWRDWNALPVAERRRLVDERYPPNPEMHRALAEDATKLREYSR